MERFSVTRSKFAPQIQFVADRLARKNVAELEKLATALYVTANEALNADERVEEIHRLKPHVSIEDARAALRIVDQMRAEAEEFHAQAACVYSLIRPPSTGFRRILSLSTSIMVAREASRSAPGTLWPMPWCGRAIL